MSYMFVECSALTNLNGLENWNVSKVTNFNYTFAGLYNLSDATAINDWDLSSTASFYRMFISTPVQPEFSKLPGTWNNGTFTPSA